MQKISGFCPYCHKEVTFSWIQNSSEGGWLTDGLSDTFKNKNGYWIIGICPSCSKGVLLNSFKEMGIDKTQIYPHPLPSPTDDRIPSNVKNAIDEAKLCLSVGAPMASSSMSRRAIECACVEKGATKEKKLYEQIDELFNKGIITEQIKDWAHSVRWVGNDGAHPTNLKVSKEDAKDVLDLAEQLMNILYVMASIAQKHKETHNKK